MQESFQRSHVSTTQLHRWLAGIHRPHAQARTFSSQGWRGAGAGVLGLAGETREGGMRSDRFQWYWLRGEENTSGRYLLGSHKFWQLIEFVCREQMQHFEEIFHPDLGLLQSCKLTSHVFFFPAFPLSLTRLTATTCPSGIVTIHCAWSAAVKRWESQAKRLPPRTDRHLRSSVVG